MKGQHDAEAAASADWESIALPVPDGFQDVSVRTIRGTGPADIWVLASARKKSDPGAPYGLSFHFDGKTWSPAEIPGRATLSIVPISPTDAWAVGAYGTVSHWDGRAWTTSKIEGIDYDLIDAAGWHDDIWVAVAAPHLIHFDGKSWTRVAPPELGDGGVYTVLALPGHELIVPRHAGKDTPGLLRLTGGAWKIQPVGPGGVALLAGSGPRDVWAVGARKYAYHFDGFAWSKLATPDVYTIGAWAASPSEAYLVGEDGMIAVWNGTEWRRSPSGTRARLWTVYAPHGGKPMVGGDKVLLRKR